MKRKIAALLMGTTLSVAVCGYSVQAMTYGYDMGGKVFISEDSSSSNLTEEEKEKLSDWHKEEMRNELAYLECYGVTYDADSDTLYYQGKTVRWLIDRQLEDTYKSIQMPEGEIDVYTVREDDYRLTGVRIATQVWNWNAMFEGKLKVGKKKETAKERTFSLGSEEQEGHQDDSDSEMEMVVSHEELLQTLHYREFVDSRGEFAIIKLPDGKMTVVNRQGEQVLEPGDYRDMKLLDGNILFYRHRRKEVCYYDLLSGAIIDDGPNVYDVPKVVTLEGWEFIKYGDVYMSRTYEHFSWPYCPSKYDLFNFGDYLIYRYNYLVDSGCQEWYYYEGGNGLMMKATIDSNRVCFLRGDYEHVYWKCATLRCGCIVVMDSKQDYYLVDSYLKKTYIGCNNPKNENEDLHIVMPRLGKKYYDEMMLQEKKKEASEMILLHEKSVAGHVELYQAGKKWGIKVDGRVVVPPLYRSIAQPVGAYCAFEEIPRYWGIMTLKGKVIVDAKYEKVEIRDGGIAVVTDITGKTQTIHLK